MPGKSKQSTTPTLAEEAEETVAEAEAEAKAKATHDADDAADDAADGGVVDADDDDDEDGPDDDGSHVSDVSDDELVGSFNPTKGFEELYSTQFLRNALRMWEGGIEADESTVEDAKKAGKASVNGNSHIRYKLKKVQAIKKTISTKRKEYAAKRHKMRKDATERASKLLLSKANLKSFNEWQKKALRSAAAKDEDALKAGVQALQNLLDKDAAATENLQEYTVLNACNKVHDAKSLERRKALEAAARLI